MPLPLNCDRRAVQAGAGDGGEVRPRALDERARVGQAPLVAVVEAAVLALGQRSSGLQTTPTVRRPSSSGQSKTKTARSTPIWQAASPTPSAAYIVSTMSATSRASSSSYAVTGCCTRCMTSSPHRVIGRTIPPAGSGPYGACSVSGDRWAMRKA